MGLARNAGLAAAGLLLLLPLLTISPDCAEAKRKRARKAAPAQTSPPPEPKQEEQPPEPPKPSPPQKQPAPPILLRPGLRFVVRPTLLGLVPPADDTGYGECFVRVTRAPEPANPGMGLFFEVKERIDDSTIARSGQLDGVTDTRIRRGDINIADLSTAEGLMTPLDWGTGSFATQTGLLWLSRSAYDALLRDSSIPWPAYGKSAESQAESATENLGADNLVNGQAVTPTRLILVDRKALYPCRVNGAMVDLPALRMTDSQSKVDYWLLADPANPLILKVTPRPDALTAVPPQASAETRSTTRSAGRGRDKADAEMKQAPLSTERFGAGFAIVEIDF